MSKKEQYEYAQQYLRKFVDSSGDSVGGSGNGSDSNNDKCNPIPLVTKKSQRTKIVTAKDVFERMTRNYRYTNASSATNEMARALGLVEYEHSFEAISANLPAVNTTSTLFQQYCNVPGLDEGESLIKPFGRDLAINKFKELPEDVDLQPVEKVFYLFLRSVCDRELDTIHHKSSETKEVATMNLARHLLLLFADFGGKLVENRSFVFRMRDILVTAQPDFAIYESPSNPFSSQIVALAGVEVKKYDISRPIGQIFFEALAVAIHNYMLAPLENEIPRVIPILRMNGPMVTMSLFEFSPEYIEAIMTQRIIRPLPVVVHLSDNDNQGFNLLIKQQREKALKLILQLEAFSKLQRKERTKIEIKDLISGVPVENNLV